MNEQLLRLLSDTLGISACSIHEDTAMANTPAWDSVAHLNVCMAIESDFRVSLSPEEMIEMTGVAAIQAVLRKHRAL
jgi:acyl carrier protein